MFLKLKLFAAGVVVLGLAGPALAHHSFSMFDNQKEMTLVGVVKEFQWTNPHTWIQLNVKNDKGQTVEWAIEGGSPNALGRRGWKRTSLKAGDKVTVKIHPLKSGEAGGSFVSAMKEDGTVVGGPPAGGPPPAAGN